MAILFLYYGMVVAGYFIGSKCRDRKDKLSWTGKLLMVAVSALVFFMGIRMGSNEEVVSNLGTIGLKALFMTVVIMAGSIVAVIIARKLLSIDRYGQPKIVDHAPDHRAGNAGGIDKPVMAGNADGVDNSDKADSADPAAAFLEIPVPAQAQASKPGNNGLSMTGMILLFVALGVLCGYFLIPKLFTDIGYFEEVSGKVLVVGLSVLLFFVGIDLGLSGSLSGSIKAVGPRILVFPVAIVLGSLAAAFLCSFVLPITGREALAIGAGFGWYTYAPVVITEQGHIVAGAISFMHNVMRELGGIILLPFVAQKIGYIEATSLPGVASMDMFIPIVERVCGEKLVIYSFLIGLFQSAMASILVPLFIVG